MPISKGAVPGANCHRLQGPPCSDTFGAHRSSPNGAHMGEDTLRTHSISLEESRETTWSGVSFLITSAIKPPTPSQRCQVIEKLKDRNAMRTPRDIKLYPTNLSTFKLWLCIISLQGSTVEVLEYNLNVPLFEPGKRKVHVICFMTSYTITPKGHPNLCQWTPFLPAPQSKLVGRQPCSPRGVLGGLGFQWSGSLLS